MAAMELLKLPDAAIRIGVSYPTLKQWIYRGKIRSVRTAGGHHRIPMSEVDRLLGTSSIAMQTHGAVDLETISGRNKLLGTVVAVRVDGLLAQVTIDVGGQLITSIITSESCASLGLEPGTRAFALIKATEVMVIRG